MWCRSLVPLVPEPFPKQLLGVAWLSEVLLALVPDFGKLCEKVREDLDKGTKK